MESCHMNIGTILYMHERNNICKAVGSRKEFVDFVDFVRVNPNIGIVRTGRNWIERLDLEFHSSLTSQQASHPCHYEDLLWKRQQRYLSFFCFLVSTDNYFKLEISLA